MNFPIIISIKSISLSKQEKNFISKIKPFGVIIFARNISNIPQISKLNKSIKLLSKNTLIFIDQEGGIVNRFKKFKEFNFLDNFELYKIYLRYPSLSKQLVFLKSFITSYYLKKLNFDINTVPVLDLPIKNTILMIKKRTFGPNELKFSKNKDNRTNFFAKRFAAKEALSKSFGTGIRDNLSFKDIEILNDKMGKPFFYKSKKIDK